MRQRTCKACCNGQRLLRDCDARQAICFAEVPNQRFESATSHELHHDKGVAHATTQEGTAIGILFIRQDVYEVLVTKRCTALSFAAKSLRDILKSGRFDVLGIRGSKLNCDLVA